MTKQKYPVISEDCSVCLAGKRANEENRELSYEELVEAFQQAKSSNNDS
ncbi:MAG: hypothetical protein HYV33_00790 [Candidatus Kerfeldbacteria bacterium]|nr:hypothetical protein [Candidatus Kerfeldbacteria bacterium]